MFLEDLDLSLSIPTDDYKKEIKALSLELGSLQRKARENKLPVIILFEGFDASGKGTLINNLLRSLDARGFNVYPINSPTEDEKLRPFLWRFWIKTPSKGRIAIFDRSWYGELIVKEEADALNKKKRKELFGEINSFERTLNDDGFIIIKFFLHISKKEQKKRFSDLKKNKSLKWKVGKDELLRHKNYEKLYKIYQKMFKNTSCDLSPWYLIESHDENHASIKAHKIIIKSISDALFSEENKEKKEGGLSLKESFGVDILSKSDLSLTLDKHEYRKKLKILQEKLRNLEHEIYIKRIPVIILYEGFDAAGKGGNIKRLTWGLDPRGYTVVPVAAPSLEEASHHYLWRFWKEFPKAGHITIFDRSWYGRVLVERVEGFCSDSEWMRAYSEINETEAGFTSFGGVILKFFINISDDEQLRRFKERESISYKNWKITDEDYRNREKKDIYYKCINDMLYITNTYSAPWTVIEGNCKYYARIKALECTSNAIEKALKAF
jgi:polyphosphate:AMP phosphotransferase